MGEESCFDLMFVEQHTHFGIWRIVELFSIGEFLHAISYIILGACGDQGRVFGIVSLNHERTGCIFCKEFLQKRVLISVAGVVRVAKRAICIEENDSIRGEERSGLAEKRGTDKYLRMLDIKHELLKFLGGVGLSALDMNRRDSKTFFDEGRKLLGSDSIQIYLVSAANRADRVGRILSFANMAEADHLSLDGFVVGHRNVAVRTMRNVAACLAYHPSGKPLP